MASGPVRDAADRYRAFGWNPLPSDPTLGHPPYTYTTLRDRGAPESLWNHFPLDACQLATGSRWGLVVVDLDGEMAGDVWRSWTLFRPVPATWTVRTPRGGQHLWFGVPQGGEPIAWRFLWRLADPSRKDGWAKHEAIELLGDGRLAMAPPSVRIKEDGEVVRYEFEPGHGPDEIERPAPLPEWVLTLPEVSTPRIVSALPRRMPLKSPRMPVGERLEWRSVFQSISDPASLAADYGLRLAAKEPNPSGWMRCHAIDREDRHPSAGFNPTTGAYAEKDRSYLRFFELIAALSGISDWRDAITDVADRVGLRRRKAAG
jgi:hypothetical protein